MKHEMGACTCIKERYPALICGPEILALILCPFWSGSLFLVRCVRIHGKESREYNSNSKIKKTGNTPDRKLDNFKRKR